MAAQLFRGGPLTVHDGQAQKALAALTGHIDTALAAEVWQGGGSLRAGPPGLVPRRRLAGQPADQDGRLYAVIDFGTGGVGDPACGTTIAWTSGQSSRVFTERLPVDQVTWTRGRGWAIWKP